MALFDHRTGKHARCRKGGLRRAAFWRSLGFPNLALALAAKKRYAAERRAAKEAAELARKHGTRALLESTREDNY